METERGCPLQKCLVSPEEPQCSQCCPVWLRLRHLQLRTPHLTHRDSCSHLFTHTHIWSGVCLTFICLQLSSGGFVSPFTLPLTFPWQLVSLCRWFLISGEGPIGARALTNTKTLVKLTEAYIKLVRELVVDRYIGRYLVFFSISASADKFFCLADVFEVGLLFWWRWERQRLTTQCSHSPSCLLSSLTVLSNIDRSLSKAPFTLVRFRFKTHNFCYGYAHRLHYSGVFEVENWDFWKRCRPRFSLKTLGLRFSVNGAKRRLLKTMVWLPTFALCILDDSVNNNIMLIVVPIDMYR